MSVKASPLLLLVLLTACSSSSDPVHGDVDARVPPPDDVESDASLPPTGDLDAGLPPGDDLDAGLPPGDDGGTEPPGPELALPPVNASFDYQLGGAYTPPMGVIIVSRDRNDPPAEGLYNICYVNGFQAQPDEESFWLDDHPDLVLRDNEGDPVIDADWDEMLLDVSTPAKREALAAIIGGFIEGCADAGFDAVEIDNLDSYSRSGGRLTEDNAVAAMALFSSAAHQAGLAIAQKNSAEIVGRKAELGTDFAVAEECNRYSECDTYTDVYGDHVLVIEYRSQDFDAGCEDFPNLSIILRDVPLRTAGSAGYVYDGC
jgi:hypothetical protein